MEPPRTPSTYAPEEKPAATDEEKPAEPDVPPDKGKDKARDAAVRTVDADTIRRAQLLVPGMAVTDADRLCAVQRAALRTATARDAAIGQVVTGTLRGATLDGCDCVTLDAAFAAASEVAKAQHNRATADGLTQATARDFGHVVTPAEINAKNAEFYGKKGV